MPTLVFLQLLNPTFSAVICDSPEPAMTIPDVFPPGQRKKLAFRHLDGEEACLNALDFNFTPVSDIAPA